ncbi:uncharacterized protein LOC134935061 [Pseudophryne corroboree]|uniref:uncharacterized protein LOC134935061 n=1 Tax=Pseudophryne corroboree TaxID=495146 RepID=UPI0030814A57
MSAVKVRDLPEKMVHSEQREPAYTHSEDNMDISPEKSSCLFPIKEITPYTTILDLVDASRIPELKRNLLDLLEKFDINDLPCITEDNLEETAGLNFQITSIQDQTDRTFILKRDTLWAKHLLLHEEKELFTIKLHRVHKVPKNAVTVQVLDQNLYLSSIPDPSGYVQLLSPGEKIPDFNDPETSKFFFYLENTDEDLYSFESSTNSNCFISTPAEMNDRVTIQPISKKDIYHMDFKVDQQIIIPTSRLTLRLSLTQKANITDLWIKVIRHNVFHEKSLVAEEDFATPVNALTSTPESPST